MSFRASPGGSSDPCRHTFHSFSKATEDYLKLSTEILSYSSIKARLLCRSSQSVPWGPSTQANLKCVKVYRASTCLESQYMEHIMPVSLWNNTGCFSITTTSWIVVTEMTHKLKRPSGPLQKKSAKPCFRWLSSWMPKKQGLLRGSEILRTQGHLKQCFH